MDALSDVLRVVRLKGGVFLNAEFAGPWCLSVKVTPESCAPYLGRTARIMAYHYVVDGRMYVRCEDGREHLLEAGESILFPYNDHHVMGSDLRLPPIRSDGLVQRAPGALARLVVNDGSETRIVCGFLGGVEVPGNPIANALPAVLRVDMRQGLSAGWVRSTFRYAAEEVASGHMGSEAVLARLSELLFIEAVRRHVATLSEGHTGWLAGLKDPFVSRAIALLHARIAEPWTVDALGREVGLSRSALAERFVKLLGMPPMQYLGTWRIHVAAQELRHTSASIPEIAEAVGYESEASLARAFKRVMGRPPASWRRQQRA